MICQSTAAISYPNGTFVEIAKIDVLSSSYKEMMTRLSLRSSMHLRYVLLVVVLQLCIYEGRSPPYAKLDWYFKDLPRRLLRKGRKRMGFPASADVGELARVIVALRQKVETGGGGEDPDVDHEGPQNGNHRSVSARAQ